MHRQDNRSASNRISMISRIVIGGGAALLIAGTFIALAPNPASAKPEFAAQTGLPCGQCHTNPAGGGDLKAFGKKFKANGNKIR